MATQIKVAPSNLIPLLFALVLAGCSDTSLTGVYAAEDDPDNAFQFFENGTWTAVGGGIGGNYTLEGGDLLMQGGGGFTMTGKYERNQIVLEDRDLFSGQPTSVVLRKR